MRSNLRLMYRNATACSLHQYDIVVSWTADRACELPNLSVGPSLELSIFQAKLLQAEKLRGLSILNTAAALAL